MWYVLQTDIRKEDEARRLLLTLDGVRDVYLPIYRRTVTADDGTRKTRFLPTISGFLFANIDDDKVESLVTDWGYFKYAVTAYDPETREHKTVTAYSPVHLLCFNPKETSRPDIIAKSRVTTQDIDRLRVYNEQLAETIPDLKILDVSYESLAAEYDTVVITEGPYIGFEGVIKQVMTNGRKDRHLHFRIGNWCVSIPRVRSHRHIIIREATAGKEGRTVSAWRHIDRLLGSIQAQVTADDAAAVLRDILRQLNRDIHLDDYIPTVKPQEQHYDYLTHLSNEDAGALISLSRYFQTSDKSVSTGLMELIPDTRLRPFLTPTAGRPIPDGSDHTTLRHRDFTEIIIRTDLRPHFRTMQYADGHYRLTTAETAANPDDYLYYAHVALFAEEQGVTALVSWGEFQRQWDMLTAADREKLLVSFQEKGYEHLHALLQPTVNQVTDIRFVSRSRDIAGFSLTLPGVHLAAGEDPMERDEVRTAVTRLIDAAAPAAVEMWQGTRLVFWRKLLQRYVLLHKLPVE